MKTDKYTNMIEAFECDFTLAVDGSFSLTKLQTAIENKNEHVLKDIELLAELSYMLRHGKAEIHICE